MHSLLKGLLIIFGLTLASCSPVTTCPSVTRAFSDADTQVALSDFAIDLLKNVTSKDEDKNQIMSPISIALALALLESGADGNTRDVLKQRLLESAAGRENVLAVYRLLEQELNIDQDKTKLTIANGLFQDKNLKMKDDYVNSIKQCLNSDVQQVDFQNQLEQTRQKINQFVSQKTAQKIPELFKSGVLKTDDRFVLANAIYFKSSWKTSFNKQQTKQDTFYRNGRDQDKQTVNFMQESLTLRHTSNNDLDALELPYDDKDLAMYVVLPKARDGMRDLEKKLTGKELRDIISQLSQKKVNVQLPKFSVRSPISLNDILSKMGLAVLFSDKANFDRMSETPLKVDTSVHEAYLSLDENGTEGAAATGFGGKAMAVVPGFEDPETVFKADHPFLYAVVHKQSGAVIFLGKINSIEQQQ